MVGMSRTIWTWICWISTALLSIRNRRGWIFLSRKILSYLSWRMPIQFHVSSGSRPLRSILLTFCWWWISIIANHLNWRTWFWFLETSITWLCDIWDGRFFNLFLSLTMELNFDILMNWNSHSTRHIFRNISWSIWHRYISRLII